MLSRSQIKYIQSLQLNKSRKEHRAFVVEGEKMVGELLQTRLDIKAVYGVASLIAVWQSALNAKSIAFDTISEDELKKISSLSTPNQVLAVVGMSEQAMPQPLPAGYYLALDDVRDPGNLGTIIRTADWFGFNGIICSPTTVDVYNPKVVQSTMGSLFHVPIWYAQLIDVIQQNQHLPVLAATLDGKDVFTTALPPSGILLIGNESKGVSPPLQAAATHLVKIPSYGNAESLNAAMAAGILMALIRKG